MLTQKEVVFNPDQKTAIENIKGSLLIVAGAGTGKTHVIVAKIAYIVKLNLAKPSEILALTFTEKAAFEMEERVDKIMPYGYFQMWISTFHAFADRILKEEAAQIGLPANFKLMADAESIIFLRKNLFLFELNYFRPLANPNKFLEGLLTHFSRLKDEDISPKEYLKWSVSLAKRAEYSLEDKKKFLELANVYVNYQLLKIKEGVFDFSDLVFYLLELFRKRPGVLKRYKQQFKYILIDEFQDTNIAQYQLIKLLCPPEENPNLSLVGDDAQAIYKFRGASVSNILSFMQDYKRAKQVTLSINYRSNQEILDSAYQLIKHNDPDTLEARLGISKSLRSAREKGRDSLQFYYAQKLEEEAEYIANQIEALKKKYDFSDIAILVRANNHMQPISQALARSGIPYQFQGSGALFKRPEVKDLIAYLKILADLADSVSLYRVLTMDIFDLDRKDLSLILSFAKRSNLTLFESIEIYLCLSDQGQKRSEFEIYGKYLPLIRENSKNLLRRIYQMVCRHLNLIKKETAGQILYYFLADSGYLKKLVSYKSESDEKIAQNVSNFFNKLKTYEIEHEDASVFSVVEYLQMSLELGESPTTQRSDRTSLNAVNILTVHAAKGLEFPVVFLANLTSGRFPTYSKKETIPIPQELIKELLPQGDYHLEEERRLFYVGLTRAMDKVYLTASRFYEEGIRARKISPFVVEALGEKRILGEVNKKNEEKFQLSIFDFKKTPEIVVKNKVFLNNFSYSQIETYKRCPLQYKYSYVLKIPTSPSQAASFGDSIHKTLQSFYLEFMKNRSISKNRLFEIFKSMWIPIGYSAKNHEKRMKEEGKNMLARFYDKFHKKNLKIIDLEKLFKIKIDQDIFVTGKIDRVDLKEDGSIQIVDYKTGKKPGQAELEKSLQLSIYALAATNKGLYHKPLDKIDLTFYFLQDAEKISLKRSPQDLESVGATIKESVVKIRSGNFLANVGPWCDFCAFKMVCEAWQ